MGKRSDGAFKRRKNDTYDTPFGPAMRLVTHLDSHVRYCEPCAGKGDLIRHLNLYGHDCVAAWDIDPRASGIDRVNALNIDEAPADADFFITNPPWTRSIMHPLIRHLSSMLPTWLLFDADWMHNRDAREYLPSCVKIVSVGRVKWIEDSKYGALDNTAWYLFDAKHTDGPRFIGWPND